MVSSAYYTRYHPQGSALYVEVHSTLLVAVGIGILISQPFHIVVHPMESPPSVKVTGLTRRDEHAGAQATLSNWSTEQTKALHVLLLPLPDAVLQIRVDPSSTFVDHTIIHTPMAVHATNTNIIAWLQKGQGMPSPQLHRPYHLSTQYKSRLARW